MEKIEADGDAFFKEMDIKMKTAVEMRLQTTKDCFLSRPDFAFIGQVFMLPPTSILKDTYVCLVVMEPRDSRKTNWAKTFSFDK